MMTFVAYVVLALLLFAVAMLAYWIYEISNYASRLEQRVAVLEGEQVIDQRNTPIEQWFRKDFGQ